MLSGVFGRLRLIVRHGALAVHRGANQSDTGSAGRRAFVMKILLRFFGFLFAAGTILFIAGITAVAGLMWHYSKDLPDYSQLQNYEPPVMTRVHAADGSLLAEYANERRLYLPIQAVPKLVTNAFIAAEDKNFYQHPGVDMTGIGRAALIYVQNYGGSRRPQGASTITQQVAKNFLLTNELSITRKIKEALLALRIERTYSKDKILELYLNQIYLGLGAYGVAAASLLYFDKSVHELTIAEAAYLAALPKGPNNYNPFRRRDEAIARRNYVIDRMVEDGFITAEAGEKAKKEPLNVAVRPTGAHTFAAEYFAEEVRRYIFENYGEKKLYEGGLSVRTTLDPKMQVLARKTMTDGLVNFDETQGGWRGRDRQDRDRWRLGHEARRSEIAVRHRSLAACCGARGERPVGAHRSAAAARSRRRGGQGARNRHHCRSTASNGRSSYSARPAGKADPARRPGACARRRHLCRAAQGAGPVPAAPDAGNFRRHGGHGSAHRPRAGDGRRLFLRPKPVQPRDAGAASTGLFVQAAGLCGGDRQRLHAVDHRRSMPRSRSTPGRAAAASGSRKITAANSTALRRCASASNSRAT